MKKGLTLIELTIATAIIVLMSGMLVTFLRQAGPRNITQSAARNLATDLRYASALAVGTQINHAIRFDPTTSEYSIVALETPQRVLKTVRLNAQLSFTAITLPDNTATFNALGAALNPGTVTVSHTSGPSQILDLRPSGYVRIQ